MKKTLILISILMLGLKALPQEVDYEAQLASYMSEFKNNIYSENVRTDLVDELESLKDQIENQIKLKDIQDQSFQTLKRTLKKISTFNTYLRCFTAYRDNISYDDFNYINDILGIYPVEMPKVKCSLAKLYEIKVGKFRAIMIKNLLIPKEYFEYNTIKVDYDCDYNGRIISGNSMNVGGGKLRCAMYLSDKHLAYYPIVFIRCSEVKSSFDK
jgi:hypothetical protein